ncbi:MAG: Na/Pi symporter [Verrucomicrobiota bacterium]
MAKATPSQSPSEPKSPETDEKTSILTWFFVAALVYLLLIGVGVIGSGFKWASGGSEGAERIFAFATNPVVGVILGTLATALVQSSSTVTSVIVGLVAGGVPVSIAVPMIMGANMGTTITNTIVSMGSIRDRSSFGKAFKAATVHDFFNLYTILIFLPIEAIFHPLAKLAESMTSFFIGDYNASMKGFNVMGMMTKPLVSKVQTGFEMIPEPFGATLMILCGIFMILVSVFQLGKLLRKVMTGPAKKLVEAAIGRGPVAGIMSGAVITILVQSSSTTTSLVVPLAAAGILTTRQIFRFTLGANIGTCVTAVLAATSVSGEGASVAMQIALVHLLYNFFGVILFMLVPFLHDLPLKSADWLGAKTEKSRSWAFGYIGAVFFLLPAAVLGVQMATGNSKSEVSSTSLMEPNEKPAETEFSNTPLPAIDAP